MSDRPIGFVSNVKCTRDKNGRVTIHWPEGQGRPTFRENCLTIWSIA